MQAYAPYIHCATFNYASRVLISAAYINDFVVGQELNLLWYILSNGVTMAKSASLAVTPRVYMPGIGQCKAVRLPRRYRHNLVVLCLAFALLGIRRIQRVIVPILERQHGRLLLDRPILAQAQTSTLADTPGVHFALLGERQ